MSQDPHYKVGAVADLGSYLFTADEIIAFASKFDPQPFHLDAEAAKSSVFGGLCASGWHTAAVWMKMNIAEKERRVTEREAAGLPNYVFGPSPGFRNLRWMRPVFAGQTIAFAQTVTGLRPYRGQPGWSILDAKAEATNEDGVVVMDFDSAVLAAIPPEVYTAA